MYTPFMVFEAILLLAGFLLILLTGAGPIWSFAFLVIGLAFCIPGFRLITQTAPPYVPTSARRMVHMLELADIKPGDIVYDPGCGDGRLLIEAAKSGATAIGYELSIPTLLLAKWRTWTYPSVSVRYGDFWTKDYRDADVIFCYLLLDKMKEFEEKIWPTLKPGTRVISHAFPMPTIKPDKKIDRVMLYVKH